ncbi:MAG: acetyl-CoA carboxylase biotin carboxylase subunit [Alphaproteobacteria bacterium]|nr:acetyl-CoA carboxylase biotin carboxylase subunit [Alphaproteobacteria bacterium]
MTHRPLRRVLVANRGEIAVRVIRGCHEEGLQAVAVCSEADVDAVHVRAADAHVVVGPAPSAESYLVVDRILQAARDSGCDAVHPGYGFLSENARFAQAVIDAGLTWIGPPPDAIVAMGSKTGARQRMAAAGVPLVPGTLEALTDLDEARRIAVDIGFPVMLKAAAGGGGKGMRRVDDEASLDAALAAARSEARKSFADDAVYVEKLVERARHVEIQVLADAHGHVVHLFERDCSVQRRHQKVFEETPCPVLPDDVRAAMGEVACRAAAAVDYVGAGTCEFLLAADHRSFYFLEMNTRLQVEHPITELLTGVDLVRAQLRVAAGEPLWFTQDELERHGHAVECRVYAEDPYAGFRPAPGHLAGYREPAGPFVRVDGGVREGGEVPVHYDPMVAKLVVWGRDRAEALSRCRRALQDYRVVGIPTSIPFFLALFDDPDFQAGRYDTGLLTPAWLDANLPAPEASDAAFVAAAVAAFEAQASLGAGEAPAAEAGSAWVRAARWQHAHRRPW